MPERLDFITIELSSRNVLLSWDARQQLLDEVRHNPLKGAALDRALLKSFEDVSASRPVMLDYAQKAHLLRVIEHWSLDTDRGHAGMPAGILELRNALIEVLNADPGDERQSE